MAGTYVAEGWTEDGRALGLATRRPATISVSSPAASQSAFTVWMVQTMGVLPTDPLDDP
jgi:hypothetical protein